MEPVFMFIVSTHFVMFNLNNNKGLFNALVIHLCRCHKAHIDLYVRFQLISKLFVLTLCCVFFLRSTNS